jgi:putative NADPH-quinone reductase
VFAFPIWWEAMPAATKGFLDRVVAKGVHFDEIEGAKGNPFRNRMTRLGGVTALTVMTTPDAVYRWWFRAPVTKILFRGAFGKVGVKNLRWRNYANVTAKSDAARRRMLDDTERYFAERLPAAPSGPSAGALAKRAVSSAPRSGASAHLPMADAEP